MSDDLRTYRDRPALKIGTAAEMAEWLRDTIGNGNLAGMFRRGEDIVYTPRVGDDGYVPLTENDRDHDGPAQVRPMSVSRIASYIQLYYGCYRLLESEGACKITADAMFPKDAARPAVDHAHMMAGLRGLRGVAHSPIPRADGSILDTPGYDSATKLLYLPMPGLVVEPVPDEPTDSDVAEALKQLRWIVKDFSFVSDHDEANYLGLLLTPLLRELTPPPYKLGAIGAPQPGSGKSLLASLLRILHGGVFRSEVPPDDAEMRKAITTILDTTTGPVVQLDNVSGVLRSSVLAGLLTSATWEDRYLGGNRQMRGHNDRLWVLTGNNLTLGGDLVRRTVWVTIDPACPDPHLRTGFDVPDLAGWVGEHRGELLHHALVLIRNWVAKGKPTSARGSDSYAAWTETVSGILTTAGHSGVFDHRESARQSIGVDDSEWAEFLGAVHKVFDSNSFTVKELLSKVGTGSEEWRRSNGQPIALDVLPTELAEKAARTSVDLINRSLGRWLANRDGRWAGELVVRRAGKDRNSVVHWQVRTLEQERAGRRGGA